MTHAFSATHACSFGLRHYAMGSSQSTSIIIWHLPSTNDDSSRRWRYSPLHKATITERKERVCGRASLCHLSAVVPRRFFKPLITLILVYSGTALLAFTRTRRSCNALFYPPAGSFTETMDAAMPQVLLRRVHGLEEICRRAGDEAGLPGWCCREREPAFMW